MLSKQVNLLLLALLWQSCSAKLSPLFGTTPIGDYCNDNSDCQGSPDTTYCNANNLCWCLDDLIFLPIGDSLFCLRKATENGEECMDQVQCQQGVPGSLSDCLQTEENPSKKICNCTQNAIYEPPNHRCYPRATTIGDGCTVNKQCTVNLGDYSTCTSKYNCDCVLDAIPNLDNTSCLPIRDNLLDECELDRQCEDGIPGLLSECADITEDGNPTGLKGCQCKENAINDPETDTDECYEKRNFVGEECMVNAQCKFNLGDLSECSKGECGCIMDVSVSNNNRTTCLPTATRVGEECIEKQQCTSGIPGPESDCVPSLNDPEYLTCSCTDKAVQIPEEEICLKKAEAVGDLCSHPIQCTSNLGELSKCSEDNKCTCIDNMSIPSQNRDMCLEIINELDRSCIESSQCQKGEPGSLSLCQQGKCECSPDSTNEPGQNLCRPRSGYIGGDCDVNAQCKANLGDLSECQNRKCICTPNNGIPSFTRLECLAIINFIGNDCQEPQQCKEGVPGEHSDCIASNTIPGSSKVCNCTAYAIRQPGQHKCHLKAEEVGANCEVDAQCQVNLGELSECDETFCSCIDGKSIPGSLNNKCLPIVDTIGGPCEENPQCNLGAPGLYSECRRADAFPYQPVCNCTEEGINQPGKHECLRKADTVYEPCIYDGQCTANLGNQTECSDSGTCGCIPGAVPNSDNNQCIPGGVLISQPCFDTQQCVGTPGTTSICTRSNICDCLNGYIPSSRLDDCLPVLANIGDECIERHQCQQGEPGEHSDCFTTEDLKVKVCNCTAEATTEAGGNKCHLKAVNVGDPCLVNIQCVANLQFSQCLGGNCRCFSNSTASSDNTKCLQIAFLDEPCIDSNQCSAVILNAECSDEELICKCISGFIPHPYKPDICILLATHIGDSCDDEVQCQLVQDSYCAGTETCECVNDTFIESISRDKCLIKREHLNESCAEAQQCMIENSECMGQEDLRSCQCNPDEYVVVEDLVQKCLPVINLLYLCHGINLRKYTHIEL